MTRAAPTPKAVQNFSPPPADESAPRALPPCPKEAPRDAHGRVTVFNRSTGEALARQPIDAREMVAQGGWSFDPPEAA